MIFDDLQLRAKLGQLAQTVRSELLLLFKTAPTRRVDANYFAAEELRGLDPFVMVLDGLLTFGCVRVS